MGTSVVLILSWVVLPDSFYHRGWIGERFYGVSRCDAMRRVAAAGGRASSSEGRHRFFPRRTSECLRAALGAGTYGY